METEYPNAKCMYYNWGGTGKYTSYPREYGARCEFYNKFFDRVDGRLNPNCKRCFRKDDVECKI